MNSSQQTLNGALDPSFALGGLFYFNTGTLENVMADGVVAMPNGKLAVGGARKLDPDDPGGLLGFAVACLGESGQPDPSFGTTAPGLTVGTFMPGSDCRGGLIFRTADNKLLLSGLVIDRHEDASATPALARFHENGRPDESFGGGNGQVRFTFPPPQASGGERWRDRFPPPSQGFPASGAASASAPGEVSPTEHEAISQRLAMFTFYVTPLASGKLVISGTLEVRGQQDRYYSVLARLNENGMPDPTFGSGGYTHVLGLGSAVDSHEVLPDGKILVCGHLRVDHNEFVFRNYAYVGRFTENGQLDTTYGEEGFGFHNDLFHPMTMSGVDSMVVHGDGKVVLIGNGQIDVNSPWNGVLGGLDANGMVDPDFNAGRRVDIPMLAGSRAIVTDSLSDGDGVILLSNSGQHLTLIRYLFNGAMDTRFGDREGWWRHTPTRFTWTMGRQIDGKFLALGAIDAGDLQTINYVARFLGK